MKKINLKTILIVAAVVAIVTDLTRLYLNIKELSNPKSNGTP
ncbi:hypothetical protein [Spirosoma sp. 48-14]|nr:hypothetical protein [Spirosoma sp. 48-14]